MGGLSVGRPLEEVVRRVLTVIPESETELRQALEKAADDASWKPPEGHAYYWRRGGLAFHARFGEEPPATGWGKQAFDIWMDREKVSEPDESDELGGAVIESQAPPPPASFIARVRGFLGM